MGSTAALPVGLAVVLPIDRRPHSRSLVSGPVAWVPVAWVSASVLVASDREVRQHCPAWVVEQAAVPVCQLGPSIGQASAAYRPRSPFRRLGLVVVGWLVADRIARQPCPARSGLALVVESVVEIVLAWVVATGPQRSLVRSAPALAVDSGVEVGSVEATVPASAVATVRRRCQVRLVVIVR